jgi:hypothetical protein
MRVVPCGDPKATAAGANTTVDLSGESELHLSNTAITKLRQLPGNPATVTVTLTLKVADLPVA